MGLGAALTAQLCDLRPTGQVPSKHRKGKLKDMLLSAVPLPPLPSYTVSPGPLPGSEGRSAGNAGVSAQSWGCEGGFEGTGRSGTQHGVRGTQALRCGGSVGGDLPWLERRGGHKSPFATVSRVRNLSDAKNGSEPGSQSAGIAGAVHTIGHKMAVLPFPFLNLGPFFIYI